MFGLHLGIGATGPRGGCGRNLHAHRGGMHHHHHHPHHHHHHHRPHLHHRHGFPAVRVSLAPPPVIVHRPHPRPVVLVSHSVATPSMVSSVQPIVREEAPAIKGTRALGELIAGIALLIAGIALTIFGGMTGNVPGLVFGILGIVTGMALITSHIQQNSDL